MVPPYRTENAERERSLFNRIKRLESLDTYQNLPQTRPGGYLALVKDQLARASTLGKGVYEAILTSEIRDLSFRESQQEAQDLICDLLLREPNPKLKFLIELSFFKKNIQEAAFHFIEEKTAPHLSEVSGLPRYDLEHLSRLISDLRMNGRESDTYRSFLYFLCDPKRA